MSGGVDSSVAAARAVADGHEVVGATMKLWGGESDSGCCSVADADDARRVAAQIGISHHVFNFSDDFDAQVVAPYIAEHALGRTPNPCIECNRHLKFDRFLVRARSLGFDAVATGHHARVVEEGGCFRLRRGRDAAKDQSYVLSMLGQAQLAHCLFPVGVLTKDDVRSEARRLGLRTAAKPDSLGTCFLPSAQSRRELFARRAALHPATVQDADGTPVGRVDALELVTVGQRRGICVLATGGKRRYVTAVDAVRRTVTLGGRDDLLVGELELTDLTWVAAAVDPGTPVLAQQSAHGVPVPAVLTTRTHDAGGKSATVRFDQPVVRAAPGQTIALYDARDPDVLCGAGIAR